MDPERDRAEQRHGEQRDEDPPVIADRIEKLSHSAYRKVEAPRTARTPITSTQAYVPVWPDCSMPPTQPIPRASHALPLTIAPSISPASMPRHSRLRDVRTVGLTTVLS